MTTPRLPLHLSPGLLAGFGTLTLLAGIGLAASRPAHTAGGPIAVTVANTPLSTTAFDNPAQQPFQETERLEDNGINTAFGTVPAKKRLVIESVAAFSNIVNDTHDHTVSVLPTGSIAGFQEIDLLANGSLFPAVTQKVLLYAEAGTTPLVFVQTSGGTAPVIYVTLTGHYVDVP